MSDAKGGNKSQDEGEVWKSEGGGERRWVEGTSAVYRRSLVQDFYPAELRRNLWMPFPYPQDTNSTLPTRLLSFYRSYIPRRNGCPQSIARPDSHGNSCRSELIGFLFLLGTERRQISSVHLHSILIFNCYVINFIQIEVSYRYILYR